jgi:hypothetical protein
MAEKYTKTSGGGMTKMNGESTSPELTPAIRPVFQNAGFDDEVIEGEALAEGHAQGFGLRDGNNEKYCGDQPSYPTDLMSDFAKGKDLRHKE